MRAHNRIIQRSLAYSNPVVKHLQRANELAKSIKSKLPIYTPYITSTKV